MIRDKKKIYAEANDERTVTKASTLDANKFVTRPSENSTQPNTSRMVSTINIPARSLLVLGSSNTIEPFNYNSPNKLIGTDDNGNLAVFERNYLPSTPPKNREPIGDWLGSTQPDGILKSVQIFLEGPAWYEIEMSGCGGGGGSGAALVESEYADLKDGMPGGSGGYYKGTFSIREGTTCTIEIGCPGGGASGYIVDYTGKTAKLTNGPNGGDGGYTPIVYHGTFSGVDGAKQSLESRYQLGGKGVNGGADGGSVTGWKSSTGTADVYTGAGAGGAAVGGYGGEGGSSGPYAVSDTSLSSVTVPGYLGGAGGAGGGFGQGGNGGDGWSKAAETYGNGGIGYGAGGGGGCANATAQELQYAGCGGGGGGGTRFVCNDFEVLCGGGGGGCGGGYIPTVSHIDGRSAGSNGTNNKYISTQNGAMGGRGGTGLHKGEKVTRDTSGTTGTRGWVSLWRCVE